MNNGLIRFFTSVFLVFISPIFIIISFLVKKEMGNPVLFKQERAGQYGKPFYIYKFRTMTNETDDKGDLLPSYKRVTSLGNFLRKSSIDELPQLFNIIRGELTLIGPRPLHVEYNELYNSDQKKRLDVKPGITGLAQVNGRNNISWEEKFKLDVYYVENKSLWLDIKIMIKTFLKVFIKADINPDNQKETPRFKGGSNE